MTTRTLLFGASQGAANYLFACKEPRTYLGLLDNDPTKHGNAIHGLPVYSPTQIAELDYDEIVITTQWAMEVYKQLTVDMGLDKRTVLMPEKHKLKKLNQEPFRNPETLQLGQEIIKKISLLAAVMKVNVCVDFGTLLGLVREKDIIPWDDDIDFAAFQADAADVKSLLSAFIASDTTGVDWFIQELTDRKNEISGYLLNFTDASGKRVSFTTSFSLRKVVDGNALHLPSLGMWYAPAMHFEHLQTISWMQTQIPVPAEHTKYLTFLYGDWATPKQNMVLSDYEHLNNVEFDDVKKAGIIARPVK